MRLSATSESEAKPHRVADGSGDTIVAVATAPGRGGIGVVRLSGPSASSLARAIVGHPQRPRVASLSAFRDADGSAIDRGIALFFRAPASFTGEDVLELQAHGSPMVLRRLVRRCLELGARLAQPGEFSLRAFLNDRMDLAQAEAVADLIDAATETAARAAMRSLEGELSLRIRGVVDAMIGLRTHVEATLDFPEEEVEWLRSADAAGRLEGIRSAVADILGLARSGRMLREGVHVVLIGRPNVGKSSLLNRLAGADVAIVTEVPGTTRDAIRQSVEIDGVPLHVIDTAGLRMTEDSVEKIGIERAWSAVAKADLALLLVDTPDGPTEEDRAILDRLEPALPRIVVRNKIDLSGQAASIEPATGLGPAVVHLSARTGAGIDLLSAEILRVVGYTPQEDGVFIARERHIAALREAQQHLLLAGTHIGANPALELFAEELRLAQEALSSITGEFTADDLLGEIFGRFCIGK